MALYEVNVDPDKALELVKHGASLLILDVPPATSLGIDTQMFAVGPQFKGIKMIPPGPHFVYYNATNRDGSESSPVIGFFTFPEPKEVVVRKWNLKEERLGKLTDSSEEERFILAVRNLEFDRHLAPYDLKHYHDWKKLSCYITKDIIERIEPIGGEITVMSETELLEKGPQTQAEKRLMEQLAGAKKCYEQTPVSLRKNSTGNQRCFYTPIPHTVKQKGMTTEELTAANLDKTQILENLLDKKYGGHEESLLGELQFAFIAFLMGQSLESFAQWKAIVCLLLCCVEAPLHTRTQLFIKFVEVVSFQLKQGFKSCANAHEVSFLDGSWFSEDNFLQLLLKEFFLMVKEAQPINGELLLQTRKLKKVLDQIGCQVELEGGLDNYNATNEFAPVIVETDVITEADPDV